MTATRPGQILLTGATGNTGSFVAANLAAGGHADRVLALVRPSSDTTHLAKLGIKTHICELDEPDSYVSAIAPGALFVGVANLRFTDAMLPHLQRNGVMHAFCVTTTAVFSSYHSYSRLYREIEDRLRAVDVPLTILRPSMIYGNNRDYNMHKLIAFIEKSPVFPVFGPGTALMQPVHVEDLAAGIASAVERRAEGEFNLAGPEALTYNDVLTEVAGALGKRIRLVHIPHGLAASLVKVAERVPGFPVRHEQVMRLLEDKAFDIGTSVSALNFYPRSFRDGIRQQIRDRNA